MSMLRARAEPFGAWVRAGDDTLVAVSRAAAARLGIDGAELWVDGAPAARSAPLEVHLAVTSRCGAGCVGCYVDARPDGEAPPYEVLVERLAAIARGGAFTVAFGGGEPLSRPDVGDLAREARSLGLTPVMTTSGLGLTRERAARLISFAQVNVSYDGQGDDYARVRGFDGAGIAERAMEYLAQAGVPFGVNVVLTRATFSTLSGTVERAERLGAREAQLLRYKPAGRAKDATYLATRLAPEQIAELYPTLERLAGERRLTIRIDCAMLPLLSGHDLDAATLERFGVFGCEAGRHLAGVRVDGHIAPCSFAPAAGAGATSAWGNQEGGGDDRSWQGDEMLGAWRAPHEAEPCRSCSLRAVCRGGCRVVSTHVDGVLGPDPECPRVRAHRAAR